jgi:hypothetical protein
LCAFTFFDGLFPILMGTYYESPLSLDGFSSNLLKEILRVNTIYMGYVLTLLMRHSRVCERARINHSRMYTFAHLGRILSKFGGNILQTHRGCVGY